MIGHSLNETILLCRDRKRAEKLRRLKKRFDKYLTCGEPKKIWEFWK